MAKRKTKTVPTLTPYLDKVEELKEQFYVTDKDLEDLENTRVSALDDYFLEVADKHGVDIWDRGDYE